MLIYQDVYYEPADEYRRLHIWLPESYYYNYDRYPVVYMFDGHNLFEDASATYGHSWGMIDFLSQWEKDVIIVGIECSHNGNARLFEYSPYPWRRRMAHEPMGDLTMQWVVNVIKPLIDNEFRTWSHREATGIAGSSMGGLMAYYGVMHYNHVFSKAACLSAGFFYNMSHMIRETEREEPWPDTMVYLSWGEYEAGKAPHNMDPSLHTREARAARKLARVLSDAGVHTMVYFQKEGEHREQDWQKQVPFFMNWLWLGRSEYEQG